MYNNFNTPKRLKIVLSVFRMKQTPLSFKFVTKEKYQSFKLHLSNILILL